jgi:hypothetical protein
LENNLPSAILSTTTHTWTTLGMNPKIRLEKPATKCLRCGTVS